jgi:hypothetical protein
VLASVVAMEVGGAVMHRRCGGMHRGFVTVDPGPPRICLRLGVALRLVLARQGVSLTLLGRLLAALRPSNQLFLAR